MNILTPFGLLCLCLLVENVCSTVVSSRNDGPLVETNIGIIRGVRADDGNYTMFMGIPYATVNESNVFGNSIPIPRFEEIFEATDDSAICPQIEEFNSTTVGTLDCLHLNIYVPNSARADNLLPVMVYIYGGGFNIGFAGRYLYGPQYLVRHGVILVTLNYRLGPYGFMCLNTPEVPGNAGLKDQVTALRWINENIGSFGGDVNKVTVFGNSAGGISIGLHLISQNEKLFSGAVMQSGSPFLAPIVGEADLSIPLQLSAALGLQTSDVNAALEYLSNVDPHTLIETRASLGLFLAPCIEQEFPGVEGFLNQRPINADHAKAANISVLLGYNTDEVLNMFHNQDGPEFWPIWRNLFTFGIQSNFNFDEAQLTEFSDIVRRFYTGDEINDNVRDNIQNYISDIFFVYPVIRSIKHYLSAGTGKVYQYVFSHDGERNFIKVKDNITAPGVAHADEISYLFTMDFIPQEPVAADQLIVDRMTTMWTNFAKYRDPTPQITTLLPVLWQPITKDSPYHFLNISTLMNTGTRYEYKRMSFWDLFYKSYEEYEYGFVGANEEGNNNGDGDGNEDGEEDGDDSEESNSASAAYLSPLLVLAVVMKIIV